MPVARTMAERQVGNMRYSPGVLAAAGLFPGPALLPQRREFGLQWAAGKPRWNLCRFGVWREVTAVNLRRADKKMR